MRLGKALLGAAAIIAAALMAAAVPASAATYIFVGSWEVDQGPSWLSSPPNGPLAYTGQEAAALLFGGNASSYVTSTVDNNPADINFDAWYSVIGYAGCVPAGGCQFADNYSDKYLGLYYGPTGGFPNQSVTAAASAYVHDNAGGSQFTNYAFLVEGAGTVPEPATWALFILGFGAAGAMLRWARRGNAIAEA